MICGLLVQRGGVEAEIYFRYRSSASRLTFTKMREGVAIST